MTEPASTAAGGIALYKLGVYAAIGAGLVSVVVMAMAVPRSPREFMVALISTVVSSICGGAFIVRWLDISHWALDDLGMIAIAGVIFVAGLPAWVMVRAWFVWSEARRGAELPDLMRELKGLRDDLGRADEQ